MTLEPPPLPLGIAVPSDHQAARELIDAELAQAEAERAATALCEQAEREKANPVEFAI